MNTKGLTPRESDDSTVVFHFDVERHSIPLTQFVDTACATQEILDSFHERLFDGKGSFKLRVVASESGSFIQAVVIIVAGVTVGGAFLESDIGKGFIRGATGHNPDYWAENVGDYIFNDGGDDDKVLPDDVHKMTSKSLENLEVKASDVAMLVVRFMETDPDRLEKIGFSKQEFRSAYSAKNQVYQACVDNLEVQGIGFSRYEDFKFKRRDFQRHITALPDDGEVDLSEPSHWIAQIVYIHVNSPNWRHNGRRWQGITTEFKTVSFIIEDLNFWNCVNKKDIEPELGDRMEVQWVYKKGASRPYNIRVLKVLKFNEKKISVPFNENELSEIIKDVRIEKPKAPRLF